MIRNREKPYDQSIRSETGHVTTPTESSSAQEENLFDFQTLEVRLEEMKVRDSDHSLSDFTTYRPGLENTEVRYGRMFSIPLYGRDNHRYHLPVDEEEVERLEIGHICWMQTTKLLSAQIQPGIILDLGTGDGSWVQEVSLMKSDCNVIGIDQYFLETPPTPNQAGFEVDDCELECADRQATVTMVMRDSFLWVRDHQILASRIHGRLAQGGWFQNQETRLSGWNSNKSRVCEWRDEVLACARKLGIKLHTAAEMRRAMEGAGFVEYHNKRLT